MERGVPLYRIWFLLWITYGLLGVIFGLDKFFNIITVWHGYLAAPIAALLGGSAFLVLSIFGVVEIVAGALIFTRFTRLGAYILFFWLLAVSINLLIAGLYDIALRDVVIAVGALVLAKLTPLVRGE